MKYVRTRKLSLFLVLSMVLILLTPMPTAQANEFSLGNWKYEIINGNVTITDYVGDEANLSIPSTLDGKPVTAIGQHAFALCSSMESITIPSSVTSIGQSAFFGCSSITRITILDGVKNIANWAFSGCSRLTSITIPASVTSIGNDVFFCCASLTSINVDNKNNVFSSQDGVLYNKDKTSLWRYPQRRNSDFFKIPNNTKVIENNAFSDCFLLTDITIPDSVKYIGNEAFSDCYGLKTMIVPASVTSVGNNAFSGCYGLTRVTIPSSVKSIRNYTFSGCSSLTSITIPDGVEYIGYGSFSACYGLKIITVPASVTYIGEYAFSGCKSLEIAKFMGEKPHHLSKNAFSYTSEKFKIVYSKNCESSWADYNENPKQSAIFVSGITINKKSLTILKGKKKQLKKKITPTNATDKNVRWSSSNPKVATVSQSGVVRGKGQGKCKITVMTKDGNEQAVCKITVTLPIKKIKLNKTKVTIKKGKSYILKAMKKPKIAKLRTVSWSSSNKKVATVSKGKIKGIKKGKCYITVKAKFGGKKAKCKVTVK